MLKVNQELIDFDRLDRDIAIINYFEFCSNGIFGVEKKNQITLQFYVVLRKTEDQKIYVQTHVFNVGK